ncbi:DUF945 family protein [Pseudoalteromonas piscicida]|uniref:DUF945 domain-containing protein n=1 Tax=Pseudoalteromonas piscicida TaxID=43662 RepID=A0A2A5JJS0_PSEO7|nr:DUF945 family protein [Pseudoalteromonas piscicida]PCK29647.1 hypothetical protein CEX98_21725 [Pseudoalteromonas piscicida]
MNKSTLAIAVVVLAGAGYVGANYYVNAQVKQDIAQQIENFEADTGLDVSFENSSVDLFTRGVELTSLQVAQAEQSDPIFTIDKLNVVGYEQDKISPLTELTLEGLKLGEGAVDFTQGMSPELVAATYHLKTSIAYDEASGDSQFAFATEAEGIVKTAFNASFGNSKGLMDASLAAAQIQGDTPNLEQELQVQSKMMAAMQSLELQSLGFTIDNSGTLGQLIESELTQQGMSKADFQANLAQQLQMMMLPLDIQTAVNDFAGGMESLAISVTVPKSQNIMALGQQLSMAMTQNPDALQELVNIKASGK